jgi:mannosyltransferase
MRWPDWMLITPAAVTLAMMLWGITGAPYWKDEADTLSAADRSVPGLLRLLGHVDAVHGLYYLMMWPVVHVAGLSEFDARLPSAIAMAAAALGVAAIGRRIRSRRTGLYAGLVFAVLPLVSFQGQDARPYAAETAAAVLATCLLLRVVDKPVSRRLTGYGLSLVLLGYLHLFGLLIIPAHALALIPLARLARARLARARRAEAGSEGPGPGGPVTGRPGPGGDGPLIRRWLATAAAACALTVPVIWLGWLQRGQIKWLPKPRWHDVQVLAIKLAGAPGAVLLLAVLAVIGITRADWPDRIRLPWLRTRPRDGTTLGRQLDAWAGRPDAALTSLTLPWLVLPPAILLAVSLVAHVYTIPYVTFCLPALALLAGAGLAALARPLRYAALAVAVVLVLPVQHTIRGPNARPDGLARASQILVNYGKPGDDVYYPRTGVPGWNLTYPRGFGSLDVFGLAQTAAQAGRLVGIQAPVPVIEQRLPGVHRLWVIEIKNSWRQSPLPLGHSFKLVRQWHVSQMLLRLYIRLP